MAQVTVLRAGLMMTVQDAGRAGFLRFGVSGSGPMDPEALRMANALVGNDPEAAALEFAYVGGVLRFADDRMVAVCAAATDLKIDGARALPWRSHLLRAGQELSVGATPGSVWGYVAVSGGIATPPVLGARSTHLRTGIGGLGGRALQDGDDLPLGAGDIGPVRVLRNPWRVRGGAIRVVMGPQDDYFSPEILRRFLNGPYAATNQRDRMALILDGPDLPAVRGHDIVSDGTLAGSIQVPGSGRPMVLMADRQTTGGYPKIATVTGIDLPRLAQMPTGRRFRFQAVPQDRAEDLLIAARAAFRHALAEVGAP
ncbi:biotin-dependent carboxyltransferase [Sinirhodobacter populi]|uniref:Biotin-dependent carboxyltransferase n=1 Tax=Paenirhodobacter populi TaxID=2306993 RepID=A0A443K6A7_9RHOB|nr:biotin-dependent carboxyltransferase family protein [Sinirhodobacter populi]RWR28319.1 biotin-dependent carboxyltransferase [Sinirhodobacter populi]